MQIFSGDFFYDHCLKACFIKKNIRSYLFISTLHVIVADILLYSVIARVMRVLVISKQMAVMLHFN